MDAAQKKLIADLWDEEHERQLEEILAENEELRKVFEENPEKKELYKFKILDAGEGGGGRTPSQHFSCLTCMFAETIDPIGRQPQTRYCMIYGAKDSHGKPDEVLYGGEPCEYYERESKTG